MGHDFCKAKTCATANRVDHLAQQTLRFPARAQCLQLIPDRAMRYGWLMFDAICAATIANLNSHDAQVWGGPTT
jgi:hypothetical protein